MIEPKWNVQRSKNHMKLFWLDRGAVNLLLVACANIMCMGLTSISGVFDEKITTYTSFECAFFFQ
jgi:predicted ribosome-associated RNA-binding protein Tma20